jgi:hypothetical protein
MIAYFPTPFPDELWYSICSRFSDHMRFGTETGVMQALYGSRHAIATVDLPHRLAALASKLPSGHPCTVDAIMDQHTFLSYYSPFLRTATYGAARRFMADADKASIRVKCGACTNRVRPPKHFQSCPECDKENREKFGETYWRRLFQVPGVQICPNHEVFLAPSNIRLDPLTNRHKYFSADKAQLGTRVHRINPKNSAQQILLELARRIDWLLRRERLNPGLEFLHQQYSEVLASKAFATRAGSVRMSDLRRAIIDFYGQKILELLQCGLPERVDGWLGHLLRKSNTAVAPLRHLLLLTTLNVDLERFFYPASFKQTLQPTPESIGSWPCLNPVCKHRGESRIDQAQLEPPDTNNVRHVTIRCRDCGFTYQLREGEETPTRANCIIDYGATWKNSLREKWADTGITLRSMARTLGVDPKTVKQRAVELRLSFPRKGKRPVTTKGLYVAKRRDKTKDLESHRRAWIDLGKNNPTYGTKQLRALAPALYAWLYRNDLRWLVHHKPARKKPLVARAHVNWANRDEELVGHIATIAAQIKNRVGQPQRVTVTAIGRALGKQSLFEAALAKLPLTRSVINSVLESGEEFAVRRIRMAARKLRQSNGVLQRWKLARAAGLHYRLERQPEIKAALDYEVRPPVSITILQDRRPRPRKSRQRPAFVPARVQTWAIVSTAGSY